MTEQDEKHYKIILDLSAYFNRFSESKRNPTSDECNELKDLLFHGKWSGFIDRCYDVSYLALSLNCAIIERNKNRFWCVLEERLTPHGKKLFSVYRNALEFEEDEK